MTSLNDLLTDLFRPAHFFVAPGDTLEWEHVERHEVSWEIYRGQLLDPAHTRITQHFEAWNVYRVAESGRATEPLLSLKLDAEAGRIHVVRAIHCYGWEGYHAGENIYLSRETRKWVRELVGTVDVGRCTDTDELRDEIGTLIFHAIVGVSRLPLTSVEAPLPDFSLGRLAYFYRSAAPENAGPIGSYLDLMTKSFTGERNVGEKTRMVEFMLRATPTADLGRAADVLVERLRQLGIIPNDLIGLLRRMFDEVALSPHTSFIDHALALLRLLVERHFLTVDQSTDFLGYLLRHLARHLTAYDLITFHHQGANYPDALLLDAALKAYLNRAAESPGLFLPTTADDEATAVRKRLRRRALRQGWLLRRFYEGLPIPDAPTSPGENMRILPPPHVRVPEEQLLRPDQRTRRLYADDPLDPHLIGTASDILRLSLEDLALSSELQELGSAVFLDRPLGVFKSPTEPDQTLLFSFEAFSRTIARKRLDVLAEKGAGLVTPEEIAECTRRLGAMEERGVPLPLLRAPARPGKVSLDDARKVARDFVFLRTSRRSVEEFLAQFDLAKLTGDYLTPEKRVVILRGDADGVIIVYDAEYRKRLELQVDASGGYANRGGREYPVAGLRVLHAWNEAGEVIAAAEGVRVLAMQ